jgi:hypothetical protein
MEVQTPSGSDGQAVQSAIDSVAGRVSDGGFGVVEGNPGTVYEVTETVTLPSNVYLRNFHFKLADGAQTTVIKSARFDELDGSNAWSAEDDVPYNFGLFNVHINGNKHNNGGRPDDPDKYGQGRWFQVDPQDPNRSGRGVAFYGKRWIVDNVVIRKCPRTGFYSAGGHQGGQPAGWKDLPESQIESLWVRNCDGHGFRFRGPHDTQATTIITVLNDGYGFSLEKGGNYFGGGFQVTRLHTYTNAKGQRFQTSFGANWNYVDNEPVCRLNGAVTIGDLIGGGGGKGSSRIEIADSVDIHSLSANGGGHGDDGVTIQPGGTGSYIGNARVSKYDGNGVVLNANNVHMGRVHSNGHGGHGVLIRGKEPEAGAFGHDLSIISANRNGKPGVRYEGGDRNVVRYNSYVVGDSTGYDTSGALPTDKDDFTIHLDGPGDGTGMSRQRTTTVLSGDGSTRRFSVEHDLLDIPIGVDATAASADAPPVERTARYDPDTFDVVFASAPAAGSSPGIFWDATVGGL